MIKRRIMYVKDILANQRQMNGRYKNKKGYLKIQVA